MGLDFELLLLFMITFVCGGVVGYLLRKVVSNDLKTLAAAFTSEVSVIHNKVNTLIEKVSAKV